MWFGSGVALKVHVGIEFSEFSDYGKDGIHMIALIDLET